MASIGQNARPIRPQPESRNAWTEGTRDPGRTYGRGAPSFKGGSRAR